MKGFLTLGLGLLTLAAQAVDASRSDYQLQPRMLAPEVWVIEGAVEDFSRTNGCNIINTGFIATQSGVLVINTGPSRLYGQQQRAAVARVTSRAVQQVVNLNLHPDYFFGNQAWADVPTTALPGTRAGMQTEGKAYEDNLYRLCGDWMRGTEYQPARHDQATGHASLDTHRLEWLRLQGHTGDDLVLIDHSSGVMFAGGLVFMDRVPTLPHARLPEWIASLRQLRDRISSGQVHTVVPSHGPVHTGTQGVDQTLDWLQWLDARLSDSAARGMDLAEVLRLPVTPRFAHWAALQAEYARNVTTLYPAYEARQLQPVAPGTVPAR